MDELEQRRERGRPRSRPRPLSTVVDPLRGTWGTMRNGGDGGERRARMAVTGCGLRCPVRRVAAPGNPTGTPFDTALFFHLAGRPWHASYFPPGHVLQPAVIRPAKPWQCVGFRTARSHPSPFQQLERHRHRVRHRSRRLPCTHSDDRLPFRHRGCSRSTLACAFSTSLRH